MKNFKLSKTGWLILSAGIFLVVLAGLGITRSSQMKQQDKLATDLATSQARLDKVDNTQLKNQMDELQQQLADNQQQLTEAKDKLRQKISSVDVTDKLFEVAAYYSVNVTIMGTTSVAQQAYQGINCSVISVSASADGMLTDLIKFIDGLNNNFSTGYVESAQMQVADNSLSDPSSASIDLIVYSYEGS